MNSWRLPSWFCSAGNFSRVPIFKLSVALDYLGLLGRPAKQAGFDWRVNQKNTTVPEVTVVGGFIASQENHDRFLP